MTLTYEEDVSTVTLRVENVEKGWSGVLIELIRGCLNCSRDGDEFFVRSGLKIGVVLYRKF